jgi:hypothetical protein
MLGEGGLLVVFGAMASPTMRISSGDVIFKQLTARILGLQGRRGHARRAARSPVRRAAAADPRACSRCPSPRSCRSSGSRRRPRATSAPARGQDPAAALTAPVSGAMSAHSDPESRRAPLPGTVRGAPVGLSGDDPPP